MPLSIRLSIAFLSLFISTISLAQNNPAHQFSLDHPEFTSAFEKKVTDIYNEKNMVGDFIFAVVDENGLVYSFAINKDITEGRPSALNNDSPIYIASHTKSFMGTLAAILEEDDELKLDGTLSEYLPDLTFDGSIDTDAITVQSLLNHTHGTFSTGLTWKTAYLGYSGKNSELIKDMNTKFLHDPSGKFRYSNVGPILAGIIVEDETGKSWKDQMSKRIFKPLGMDRTSAYVSDFTLEEILTSITVNSDNEIVDSGFYKTDITMHAAGGILSTMNDLSKWLQANINQDPSLLSANGWEKLHSPTTDQDREYFTYHRTGYSLGWDIAEYQGEEILTRFGGLAGISFHISFMPDKEIGIIAFSNENRAYILPHLMANYVYNQLKGLAADSIFTEEKLRFDESFERENNIEYPKESQLLRKSDGIASITGVYQNTGGWPDININETEAGYSFTWGELDGLIYKTADENYTSNLGPLFREFKIQGDSLLTGSLIYHRIEN